MNRTLDPSEVEALLKIPQKKHGGRSKEADTDDRTIRGWFKLHHRFTEEYECTVPAHDETPRIENGPEIPNGKPISRKRAVAVVGSYNVCRYCYIEELDKIDEEV